MLKNPLVLLGIAVVVAAGVWLVATTAGAPKNDLKPLTPAAGESLRRQGAPPKPVTANPKAVLDSLSPGAVLAPGDKLLLDALKDAVGRGEEPAYRVTVDFPFSDAPAQQVADELREWLGRKMAGLGFSEANTKPVVLWIIHLDPAGEGKYTFKVVLRVGGEPRFDQKFELPAAFKAARLDTCLAAAFAAPLAAPAKRSAP